MKKTLNYIWAISELFNGMPKNVSFELLVHGRKLAEKLGTKVASIICGHKIDKNHIYEHIYRGADRVYILDNRYLAHFIVENHSAAIYSLIIKYKPEIILGPATSRGRILMPHIAAKLGAGLTADCTELDIEKDTGNLIQIRPAIGGNIIAKIKTPEKRPQMATVRPKLVKPFPPENNRKGEIIKITEPDLFVPDRRIERKGFRPHIKKEINIQEADIIVSGGGGLKKAENFKIIYELAEELGGAAGASRNAVDKGWIGYPHQVGLSGKTVTPKLYIAIGISGAIQHLAGMKTSENIIAINKDPEAQIFRVSDLGIIGDAFDIIPRLIEGIRREKIIKSRYKKTLLGTTS